MRAVSCGDCRLLISSQLGFRVGMHLIVSDAGPPGHSELRVVATLGSFLVLDRPPVQVDLDESGRDHRHRQRRIGRPQRYRHDAEKDDPPAGTGQPGGQLLAAERQC